MTINYDYDRKIIVKIFLLDKGLRRPDMKMEDIGV